MADIEVLKLDINGALMRRYSGRELGRTKHSLMLEAPFDIDKPEIRILDVVLKLGDRFLETYYNNRGYNVFEIYDRDTANLKGWYCNLSRPAEIAADSVTWVDLALDLWAWPDGRTALLDEDEFSELRLGSDERLRVWASVRELERSFHDKQPPS